MNALGLGLTLFAYESSYVCSITMKTNMKTRATRLLPQLINQQSNQANSECFSLDTRTSSYYYSEHEDNIYYHDYR